MNASLRINASRSLATTAAPVPTPALRGGARRTRTSRSGNVKCLVAAPSTNIGVERSAPPVAPEDPMPEASPLPQAAILSIDDDWYDFYMDQLEEALDGVECGTTRVKVTTRGVEDPFVTRCTKRAQDIKLTVLYDAVHKQEEKSVQGSARVHLGRDKEGRDILKVLSHKIDADETTFESAGSLKDVKFAVDQTLGSALLMILNDFLWSIETKSMDMLDDY